MIQLILHLIGDYVTQSDWMANNKTKHSWPALCHAVLYSLPFLLLEPSWVAFGVILGSHFLIDRFRLARFLVWFKNIMLQPDKGPKWDDLMKEIVADKYPNAEDKPLKDRLMIAREWDKKWDWPNCSATGYPSETPAWLAVWLLIAADNTIHLTINYAALRWL